MIILNSRQQSLEQDEYWMQRAVQLSEHAMKIGEVPVGALLILNNQVIGEGYNCSISSCDPTAHAEIMALRNGAKKICNYRLVDTTLYVTLEPCSMCMGAIIHARIDRLVFGAYDLKSGAITNRQNFFDQFFLNHKIHVTSGVCTEKCGKLITQFFSKKRMLKQNEVITS